MDVKYVLGSVLDAAAGLGGKGELHAAVRLSGAVNGERGEGYWLLYEDVLVLLYRRLGERSYEGCCAELDEYAFADYREEKYALLINISCRNVKYACEFTPSERTAAETVINAINNASAAPQSLYDSNVLIMAGLFYSLSSGHSGYAAELLGKELYRAGKKFASENTLPDLVAKANDAWTDEQKQSVLLNLLELRMSDGIFEYEESEALRELSEVWNLKNDFYVQSKDLLLKKKRIGELFKK